MSSTRFVVPFGAVLTLLIAGCPEVPDPNGMAFDEASLPAPVLPSASDITAAIYSGTLDITVTVREDGTLTTDAQSIPFTMVVDDDGRLLDADGLPFVVYKVYYVDANPLRLTLVSRSITVDKRQIVLRFDLRAVGDLGDVTGEFSGSQTDTLTFHEDTNTIDFTRSQLYGGVDSNGVTVSFITQGQATLNGN